MSSVVPVVQDMKIYGFQNFESKTEFSKHNVLNKTASHSPFFHYYAAGI